MSGTCPIRTPDERRYGDALRRAETAMMEAVGAAIREAQRSVAAHLAEGGSTLTPPSTDYLTAVVHQKLFCTLCRADPETFAGGDAEVARAIIRNAQAIATHHWVAAAAAR